MKIQVGLGNEKNERNKSIQSEKNSINKFRDRNEHMVMNNEKTKGLEQRGFKIQIVQTSFERVDDKHNLTL